jgi:flotillin
LTRIRVASANAEAIKGENLAKEEIALSTSRLAIKQAQAYQDSETRKRQAEAAVREAQAIAETRAAIENANRVEAEKRAELEAPAKAIKAQIIVDAEAEAEKLKIEARVF